MNWTKNIAIIAFVLVFTACAGKKYAIDQVDKEEVLASIRLVNTYWQTNNKPQNWAFWDEAAYHTGNMAAYKVTKDSAALNYSVIWADYNQWKGAKSNNREDWKYSYGEGDDYALFGDWQICFQTYIDLYLIHPDEVRIRRAKEVMGYQMSTLVNDYWWWADGLYMVMPVMTKLYTVTKNPLYLDKLNTYFRYADSLMFDQDAHLYYRDGKYLYPKHKSANGKRDFWARGDGWVLAGLAKVLADLPKDYKHRPFFEQRFQQLAKAVANAQQPGGYWTRSLLDPEHAPGPETSGTAFFTYGLLWGVNNGYLNAAEYLPVVDRSWRYLQDVAVQADGSVGYVQPIGEKAIPGQVVDQNSTTNFGVGAYLLAATELYNYLDQ
ncbi:glycoside hydrolase family 88 protein [Sphingobacterium sp. lm-10]|uniref:glycoside hydrolase family 88/105 protein n=1 Tax=Sphingobacterium sp. lm-10 TaxID=2944904 RepID=UPI00201FEBA7|nr:glycoside hydrolase family 88 protein [Sphingobacterium sp. lm-10]MCL7986702.1 glycoside hydrolase family 88 protein [Sphingobacterium sp. lm-10]